MEYPRHKILIIALLMEGGVLVIALMMARYFDLNLFPITENILQDVLIGTAGAVVPFILFLFTLSSKAQNLPVLGSLRKTVLFDIKAIFLNTKLIDLVLISLMAGFGEEMLFRGVLQTKFGIVAASFIFGLIHCVSPAYMVVTTIMGFYIGAFYLLSGNLLIPVHMHFIYDLAALVYLKYFIKSDHN